jgi:hypothetical protein
MKVIILFLGYFFLHLATSHETGIQRLEYEAKPTGVVETPTPVLKAVTVIRNFNATFSWKIENINLFDFGKRKSLNHLFGPTLTAVDQNNNNTVYTAKFSIAPEYTLRHRSYYNNDHDDSYELLNYKVTSNFNGTPLKTEHKYTINGTTYDGSTIVKSHLDKMGTVEIIVKAFYYTTNESKNTILFSSLIYENEPNSLGAELLNLFKKDSDSQFTIECAGEEIKAYKPVMQARSETFNELLSNGTDRLRIADFQPKIIEKVVEFCNTDPIKDFENEETNIFAMAYSYKIPSLMAYASNAIVNNINTENAVARFKFSHFYHYAPLKTWLFDYIIQNIVEISKTAAFKSLDADLYKPILEELLKQKKII